MRDSYGGPSTSSSGPTPVWEPAYGLPDGTSAPKAPPVPPSLNQNAHDPFYNNVAPTLDFDVHVSSTKLDICWKPPHVSGQITYELTVTEGRALPFTLEFPANLTRHTMRATAGETYVIGIVAKKSINGVTVAAGSRSIKAIFSEKELQLLYDKALKYTGTRMHPFELLYRCKPKPYWDDIHHNCSNVMEKYMKDDNGQPANMINGVISGLFFSARLLPNGTLPCSSPFGNVRMLMQAVMLLDPISVNLYFADFYCNKQAHYVTIIVARKGSESDIYSQKYLIKLDMRNNPWLKYMMRQTTDGILFYASCSVWVEVLYTENVPLSWGRFDKIAATGLGTSKIGGLSNNKSCTICNLYLPGAAAAADDRDAISTRERSPVRKNGERLEDDERWQREDANRSRSRSISPLLVDEATEEQQELVTLDEEDDLDGVELPAYEMGGNSTFQTLINQRNVNDYPNWTDLIECACEIVDGVVMMEQQQRDSQITSSDARVAAAIEEMDSIVGTCDDDRIHDLAGEVHELAEIWQKAREELLKMMEENEQREQQTRANLAMAPPPPVQAPPSARKSSRQVEEDLDEYLDDDDFTAPSAATAAAPTAAPTRIAATAAAKVSSIPLPTPAAAPTIQKQPAAVVVPPTVPVPAPKPTVPAPTLNWLGVVNPVVTTPTVQPCSSGRKKKERKPKAKVKEEELDEYLDDDDTAASSAAPSLSKSTVAPPVSKDTVAPPLPKSTVAPSLPKATVAPPLPKDTVIKQEVTSTVSFGKSVGGGSTVSIKQESTSTVSTKDTVVKKEVVETVSTGRSVGGGGTVPIKQEVASTVSTEDTVVKKEEETERDLLEDSAIDLSLMDEAGNETLIMEAPTTNAGTKKDTVVSSQSIEGEDEWLEEDEDTVVLKRSITSSVTEVIPSKRPRPASIEVIGFTEEELLLGPPSLVEITPEMEEELLRA